MRVIQAGMGGFGEIWIKTVLASKDVSHSGFVEQDTDLAREQASHNRLESVPVFPTLDGALARLPADGLLIVTPPAFHKEMALAALEVGLPVLSEKPLADTLESALAIVEKAEQTGVLHMVSQNYRYNLQAQTVKKVLASGELGQVSAISIEFFKAPRLTGFHQQMRHPLLIDMAIHHFDLLRFFLESEPVMVYSRSWNPPWSWFKGDAATATIIEFEGGVTVTYHASWCTNGYETTWNGNWRFDCEGGVLLLRNDRVYLQRLAEAVTDRPGPYGYQYPPPERIPLIRPQVHDQSYVLREFHRGVTLGAIPATTCQDNIKSLRIVFDAIRSAESGAEIR